MRLFGVLNKFFKKEPSAPTELDGAVRSFQHKTGVRFNDAGLLRVALTHGSYVHEHPDTGLESMGRMELLGDSVLGLVVNEYLYKEFPGEEEGELTKMKSLLVSKAVLARRGRSMRLGHFLLLGEGEVDAGGRDRTSIVADGFESVIGAIYLDQGLEGARRFIDDTLLREASRILADSKHINYKSLLQEQIQGEMRVHPEYRVLSETGPEHEKQFTVEVAVKRKVFGRGTGKSKKEAEQAAARQALAELENRGGEREVGRSEGRAADRARERDRDRKRGWKRDRGRDRGRDGGGERECDRGETRDRDGGGDRDRGRERDGSRDRRRERGRNRDDGRSGDKVGGQAQGQVRDRDQNKDAGQSEDKSPGQSRSRRAERRRAFRSRRPRRRRSEWPSAPGAETEAGSGGGPGPEAGPGPRPGGTGDPGGPTEAPPEQGPIADVSHPDNGTTESER